MPLRTTLDEETQWQEFLSLRGQYEEALFFVARQTFAPLDGVLIDMVER
jgi:glutamate mutase epsilon subunit